MTSTPKNTEVEFSKQDTADPNSIIFAEPEKKAEGFYISKKAMKIGGATLLATIIGVSSFFGLKELNSRQSQNDNNHNNEIESTIDETEDSSIESTETEVNPTILTGAEAYVDDMKTYEEMSIDVFNTQRILERLPYAQFRIDLTEERGNYELYFGEGRIGEKYKVEYTPASLNNSGQEILDNWEYNRQISFLQSEDTNETTFDASDAAKVFSAAYTDVDLSSSKVSESYTGLIDFQNKMTKPYALFNDMVAEETYSVDNAVDSEGTAVPCKIIKFYDKADPTPETLYARFYYYEFVSYDGSKQGIWLCSDVEISTSDFN